jgi:hypothetical protein
MAGVLQENGLRLRKDCGEAGGRLLASDRVVSPDDQKDGNLRHFPLKEGRNRKVEEGITLDVRLLPYPPIVDHPPKVIPAGRRVGRRAIDSFQIFLAIPIQPMVPNFRLCGDLGGGFSGVARLTLLGRFGFD